MNLKLNVQSFLVSLCLYAATIPTCIQRCHSVEVKLPLFPFPIRGYQFHTPTANRNPSVICTSYIPTASQNSFFKNHEFSILTKAKKVVDCLWKSIERSIEFTSTKPINISAL